MYKYSKGRGEIGSNSSTEIFMFYLLKIGSFKISNYLALQNAKSSEKYSTGKRKKRFKEQIFDYCFCCYSILVMPHQNRSQYKLLHAVYNCKCFILTV